jgi:Cdc6-like AAA superfamily ATPase
MTQKRKSTKRDFKELKARGMRLDEHIETLSNDLKKYERRNVLTFDEWLDKISQSPELVLRDVFQVVHDMMVQHVEIKEDVHDHSADAVGFVNYDFRRLFVDGCDDPFFADRLFANRLMNLTRSLGKGAQNNRIYLFEGPPGSGKSTFLKNLLMKLEEYTKMPEGVMYNTFWKIDTSEISPDEFSSAPEHVKSILNDEQSRSEK